ncbi:MAG: hypothetical protein IMZ53_09040 [Thermoplasmata archaeon]|nr:hypothetical protein [Thermoplasmata archaeon]MBE3140713.1 hypothetical protein [Thermoplasmata archaeon]
MIQNKENKTHTQKQHEFNPRIIVGIIGSTDLDSLQMLKDFFNTLDGFSLIYLKTSGNPLYITSEKPSKDQQSMGNGY